MSEVAARRLTIADLRAAELRYARQMRDTEPAIARLQRQLGVDFLSQSERDRLTAELASAQAVNEDARQRFHDVSEMLEAARLAYDTAAADEPAPWGRGNDLPVLLLPVRLEVTYRAAGTAAELWVRVYPDDVHVDSHEPELTARERAAGETYWRAIWAAGPDAGRRADAWRELVIELGPTRAAWTLERLRPAGDPPATATPPGEDGPDPGPFPDVRARAGQWTRAARTTLLPDRFAFSAYRGGRLVWRHEGTTIPDEVIVGFAPPGDDAAAQDGLPWTAENHWLVDFDQAIAKGLGIKVRLEEPDLGYDALTAVGVSSATDAATGAARVEAMLEAHAYTDGLAVLPPGTPTNNTAATRSGWRSRTEPPTPEALARARASYAPGSDQPAARVAAALGVDGAPVLAAAPDALADDAALSARAQSLVSRLLTVAGEDWRLLKDTSPETVFGFDMSFLVDHYTVFVRSRGPLPTLRIGRQPYGILPATSLDLHRGDGVDEAVVYGASMGLTYFAEQIARGPRVGADPDQDAVILDLLSRCPASRRVRREHDTESGWDLNFTGRPPATIFAEPDHPFTLRSPVALPEDEVVAVDTPSPELAAFVALRPMARLAAIGQRLADLFARFRQHPEVNLDADFEAVRPELRDATRALDPVRTSASAGVLYALALPLIGTGLAASFQALLIPDAEIREAFGRRMEAISALIADFVALEEDVARRLEGGADGLDIAEVDRILCECLDTTAHRADALVTSVATARLSHVRADRPKGLHTGAYGWLVDVRPREPGRRAAEEGYVVAPSMQHAATAAVLRSGWQSHSDRSTLAINLTSERVRRASALLEGARAGQTLPAMLGYQFERGLHDAKLDRYIERFRARYPLASVVDDAAEGADEARSAIAARNVVDGQALRADRAAFDRQPPPIGAEGGIVTIRALIAGLDEAVDAVGDLLLAESVHHLVGGNPLRAGLSADTVGRAEGVPDEFEVATTPRSAIAVSFALGVLVPSGAPPAGWKATRPLAQLEPGLERWCAQRLGAATGWSFRFGGSLVTLADLDVCALDVVLGAGSPDDRRAPLFRRLLATARVAPDAEETNGRHAELALLAGALRHVLTSAAPLTGSHLDPEASDGLASADLDDVGDRLARWIGVVRTASSTLAAARASADGGAIAAALDALAGAGLQSAVRDGSEDADALLARADETLARLTGVTLPTDIASPTGDARTATTATAWLSSATALVRELLGDAVTLLPSLAAAGALTRPAHLVDGDGRALGDDDVSDWLRSVARVRPAVDVFDEAMLGASVLSGTAAPSFALAQTPAAENAPWIAVTAGPDDPSAHSCCVLAADAPPGSDEVTGFVVDAWSEAVPRPAREGHAPEEVAAIAFGYDRPDARPPQAMLLAVCPDRTRGWCMEDVHGVVDETLTLTKLRELDLVDLRELTGPLPPSGPPFDDIPEEFLR